MIDFHTHILPGVDDGASNVKESIMMLYESKRQGVDTVFATPHFYADMDDPEHFLHKRDRAYELLRSEMEHCSFDFPELYLGAEVLYFPGMSSAEELSELTLGNFPFILIEPPMMPWTEVLIDEIEETGRNLRCIPVIAHIDRYMGLLNDYSLIHRVQNRRILVQVNSSFFINRNTKALAIQWMKERKFHFIGTDCHNLTDRPPDLGKVMQSVEAVGSMNDFLNFTKREYAIFEVR